MRSYISGGITGITNHRAVFAAAEGRLTAAGDDVVNPLSVAPCPDNSCVEGPGNPVNNGHTWSCWLRYDLIALLGCDRVVTLPGWEASRGAVLEVNTALNVRIPVVSLDDALAEAAAQR